MTDKVLAADTSPEALLKQAVMGAKAAAGKTASAAPVAGKAMRTSFRLDPRLAGVSAAMLALGVVLGAGAMSAAGTRTGPATDAIAQIQQHLDAGHRETERMQAQIERIGKSLAQMQEVSEATRGESKTRGAALSERITRAEQAIAAKVAALGEKLEQAEKEQTARIAALAIERKPVVQATSAVAAPPTPQAVKATAEPIETGALAEKPKPVPSDNWAVREVYDGVAILEDRKRRLVEVGPGDTVPGVGRIETIERRGKSWVVVTRQGVITPQTW